MQPTIVFVCKKFSSAPCRNTALLPRTVLEHLADITLLLKVGLNPLEGKLFSGGLLGSGRIFSSAGNADVTSGFSTLEAQPTGMASRPPVGSQVHNNMSEYVQPEEIWTEDICHQCFFLPSALLCRAGEGAATGQCLARRIHSVVFP